MLSISELKFYQKNGYLVKKNLIPANEINKIAHFVHRLVNKEKKRTTKIKNLGGTFNNPFVYNSNSAKKREILRLNNPHERYSAFYKLARHPRIIQIVKKILGGTVRFQLGKLNFKLSDQKGGEIDWHQDWGFYPHTNDDLVTVGIYLEKCTEENGPLKVIPGSHKGKVYSHHDHKNKFVGKIKIKKEKINTNKSISLTGNAGTVTFHHVRMVNGSGLNYKNNTRPLMLYGYRAIDAWPVVDDGNTNPNIDFEKYNKEIIVGKKTLAPRIENVPMLIPLPKKRRNVSIYQLQRS